MSKPASYNPVQEFEVAWYKKHGKFTDRLGVDSDEKLYVIGDLSWNKGSRTRRRATDSVPLLEIVEPLMCAAYIKARLLNERTK